jgi:hypothetical protein
VLKPNSALYEFGGKTGDPLNPQYSGIMSLVQLGHVPKNDDRTSRAWLYGKLLVTLLAQKLIRIGRDISPSGYPLSARGTM